MIKKVERLPTLTYETAAGHPEVRVAGVDEVGRGCLAGPVVAAAVILPSEINRSKSSWTTEVTDSKLLRCEARERLAPLIQAWVLASAIGIATVEEIDRLNIYHASHLAMVRALEALVPRPGYVLVDGNVVPRELCIPASAVVKGDQRCLSIAAASILAKVWRDSHMTELSRRYPRYGFEVHKGYPTPAHKQALLRQGICGIHRRSFAPVARYLLSASL